MKNQQLYDGITEIRDAHIEEARTYRFQPVKKLRRRWFALAAALVLVIGLGALLPRLGGRAGSGGNSEGGQVYMSYAGPVFPLTTADGSEWLTAQRNVDYDFSPYKTYQETYEDGGELRTYDRYDTHAIVTDSYQLTNPTDREQTVTLLYPFAAAFAAGTQVLPQITADGSSVEASLYAGPYAGGFGDGSGEMQGLSELTSWEAYAALLADGSYQSAAFDIFPVLDQTVTVYRISDHWEPEETEEDANPTLLLSFTIDDQKTTVLTYGSTGGRYDPETGDTTRYVDGLGTADREPEPMYLIVIGDDLADYTLQGYRHGSCEPGDELEIPATVTRYETSLGEILRELVVLDSSQYQPDMPILMDMLSTEELAGYTAELLVDHGPLTEEPDNLYEFGMLEDLLAETRSTARVLYLRFTVTIPAGETLELQARMCKDASYDYHGGDGDWNRNGYDLVTRLGSSLTFTGQTASIQGTEFIEILGQNFGFDPEHGITQVTLDQTLAHYWIEVQKRTY